MNAKDLSNGILATSFLISVSLCGLAAADEGTVTASKDGRPRHVIVLAAPGEETANAYDAAKPVELGRIEWKRDFEQAAAESGKTGKPLMVLFDEVPGCGGCKSYGKELLSNPLLVEAAESLFVPVFVRNNDPDQNSADNKLLKRFQEKRLNYPVVRFMKASGEDLAPASRTWSVGNGAWAELLGNMTKALETAGKPGPKYLKVFVAEYGARKTATVCFAMGCYWTGEARLGALPGVVRTRIGYHKLGPSANEIVEVVYDTERADYQAIVKAAKAQECAQWVISPKDDPNIGIAKEVFGEGGVKVSSEDCVFKENDPNYQFGIYHQPGYYFNAITSLQATRMHGDEANRSSYLSPRQKALHGRINALYRELDQKGQKALFTRMNNELNPSQYRNLYKSSLNDYQDRLVAFLDKLDLSKNKKPE